MTVIVVMMMVVVSVMRVAAHFGALGPGGTGIAVISQEPENQQHEGCAEEEMTFVRAIGEVEQVGHERQ